MRSVIVYSRHRGYLPGPPMIRNPEDTFGDAAVSSHGLPLSWESRKRAGCSAAVATAANAPHPQPCSPEPPPVEGGLPSERGEGSKTRGTGVRGRVQAKTSPSN